jgi:alpha-glucoside transport system substrate-binding protein
MKKISIFFSLMFAMIFLPGTSVDAEKISILGVWGGSELDNFLDALKPFEERTGHTIEFEGTRDLSAILRIRVDGGNAPDLATLPGPGVLHQYKNHLVDLNAVLDMARVKKEFNQAWLDIGTVDGKLVALFMKVSPKGLFWYNTKNPECKGVKTWDELMQLAKIRADAGKPTVAVGAESGPSTGWPLTDWCEVILLRAHGAKVYNELAQGKRKWSSPEVTDAWMKMGEIVLDRQYSFGAPNYVRATGFGQAFRPLFIDTKKSACYHHQAIFIQTFITEKYPHFKAGEDFDFFPFPAINPQYKGSYMAGGDIISLFSNKPAPVALMKYIASQEFQERFAINGGAPSPNRLVSPSVFKNPVTRKAAELINGADEIVFDLSDTIPQEEMLAFWKATMDFAEDPDDLKEILQHLDQVQADTRKK